MAEVLTTMEVAPPTCSEEELSLRKITDHLVLALRETISIREKDLVLLINMALLEAGQVKDRMVGRASKEARPSHPADNATDSPAGSSCAL